MPANTSFKVQCPSCEAQIPVRDPAAIGKKIDCPKCKYRFLVEDPGDEVLGDGEERSRKGGRAKSKKKAGNNNMLILGSVLGLVAVALLAVGAYFLFFNETPKPTGEEDLVKMPGFGKNIEAARAEAKRLLTEAGVPNLKVRLINRTVSNLYIPAGIYIIDQ